jgi:hypothetical protein
MEFVIDQDNDNQFHWRIVGDDGAYLAVSAASFAFAKDARRAAKIACSCTPGRRPASNADPAEHRRSGRPQPRWSPVGRRCDLGASPGAVRLQRDDPRAPRTHAPRNALALPDQSRSAPLRTAEHKPPSAVTVINYPPRSTGRL